MLIAWHWTSWKWQKGWRPKADFKVLSRPKISLNNWKKKKTFEKRKNCQEDLILSWRFERIWEKWPLEEVLLYYLTVIIRRFSFNLEFICSSVISKKVKLHSPYGLTQFWYFNFEKHTRANEAAFIMYTTGGRGGGKGLFWGGVLKFFWGKSEGW